MIICAPNVLTPEELGVIRGELQGASFVDGASTAGWSAREVKKNLQVAINTESQARLQDIVRGAFLRNAMLQASILPAATTQVLFNRYDVGMQYGPQVDAPVMGGLGSAVRTDVAITIFLSDAKSYAGGDLVVESNGVEYGFKLDAGSAVAYPANSLHHALKGHEERRGHGRDKGIVHGAHKDRKIWIEERQREERELGHTRQPYCLIAGGGQGGIALGARLRRLGVPTIIGEKNAKPGDSWRQRYRSLVLHDPVWYDHLPYIPFPDHWPVFSPKDKIADWLEMYAKVMELNYWGNTECLKASFDETAREWTVVVRRDGRDVVLRPKQLVFATGSYGPPRHVGIEGQERFKGIIAHSSAHVSGAGGAGKRVIVVGANSSAHDICMDYWEHGADVTMIQRTPTTVVRSESLMDVAFGGIYPEADIFLGVSITASIVDLPPLLLASRTFFKSAFDCGPAPIHPARAIWMNSVLFM